MGTPWYLRYRLQLFKGTPLYWCITLLYFGTMASESPTQLVSLRLPRDLLTDIDTLRTHLEQRSLGAKITRSSLIITLLERAVEREQSQLMKEKQRKTK